LSARSFAEASPSGHAAFAWRLVLAIAIAAGAYLRITQLPSQVLVDDEWHAIHELLRSDPIGIATGFGVADYSIPLTLYDTFLADHGGVSEWQMRAPMLVAGVALLVIAPMLMRRTIGLPASVAWTALLAISPLLVYLSRTARPYSLTCLLALVAVVAFRRWWLAQRNARATGALYVATTVLAGWLHLIALSFTLLPFAWYGARAIAAATRGEMRPMRRLAWLALATLVPLAIVLVPPVVGSFGQLAEKAGSDAVTVESLYRSLLMMLGLSSPLLLAIGIALAIFGGWRLWRRDADFVGYVGVVIFGSAVAIALARPAWIQHPGVFSRYMLPALPFVLLFVAEGAAALAVRLRPPALGAIAVAMGALLLFRAGPIPGYLYRPNQFMGHARFQFDYDPAHNPYVLEIPREPMPAFYRALAKRPPRTLTLIEAPWRLESNFDPFPWYQQVHRQYVKIGLVTPVCGVRDFGEFPATQTRLRFRNFVHLSDILAGHYGGADYLVMHRTAWKTPPDATVEWPDVDACLPTIAAALGAPIYRDDAIVVFDLKEAGAARPAGPAQGN
jgi:hypothetical protein